MKAIEKNIGLSFLTNSMLSFKSSLAIANIPLSFICLLKGIFINISIIAENVKHKILTTNIGISPPAPNNIPPMTGLNKFANVFT